MLQIQGAKLVVSNGLPTNDNIMKTILVGIDFSKNAEHALKYALLYANQLNADIHLAWVDNTSSDESVIDTIAGDIRIEKRSYLNQLVEKYEPQLKTGKIKLLLKKGKVYQELAKAARQIEADLICAGTHGVSGYEQYWIGSNAYRIVTQAPCPVITIRSDYEFSGQIKKILLPLDSSLETKQKLPFAAEIAKKFGAHIHLLEVYNTPIKVIRRRIDKIGQEAVTCLKEKEVDFVLEKLESTNVTSSILEYSNQNDIDLITIMTDQGITTANKFLGPYSQQLINNALIPVLSLRAKEYL